MEIGRVVSFTGHRPEKLFGSYDLNNPKAKTLANELIKVIEQLITKANVTHFISGGALGADQVAFICVNKLKQKYPHIQNILAVPFKNQDSVWKSETDRNRYYKIKDMADEVVYVDEIEYYNKDNTVPVGDYSAKKMQLRNIYMVDQSQIVVAVYDGTKGGTANCVNYAKKKEKKIIALNPQKDFKIDKELIS